MDLRKRLNLNNYEWWRNHRRFLTLGLFLALFAGYIREPLSRDSNVRDICGRLSADLISGEKASKELSLGNKKIDSLDGDKNKITNHYYHAKYYCQGYIKGNVGLGY